MKDITKKLTKIISMLMAVMLLMTVFGLTAYAQGDGAYTVTTTTTYANPETGLIVDGGTNEALGQSMVGSVVLPTALVEVSGGRTFVTIGIGLASNVSNTRILVQNQRGVDSYSGVGFTQTGTSWAHDDTVLHLRFEMADPGNLISPIIFVDPMGRDVQFFIRLNMESATPGTGMFASEMVVAPAVESDQDNIDISEAVESPSESELESEIEEEQSEPERERRRVDIGDISLDDVIGLTIHLTEELEEVEENGANGAVVAVASISGLSVLGGGFYLFQKKKGGK